MAVRPGHLDHLQRDTGRRPVSHEHVVGIVAKRLLEANLVAADRIVLGFQFQIETLLYERVELDGRNDVPPARRRLARGGPRAAPLGNPVVGPAGTGGRQHDLLHHLADHAVRENHHRIAIFERQIESQRHEIVHLLHGIGRQHDQMVIAVPAALDGLKIVGLRRLDRTEPRTSPRHVDHHARQLGPGQIAQPLAHQTDAGA